MQELVQQMYLINLTPKKHVNRKYVLELVQKFQETGSVANKKRNPKFLIVKTG